MALSPREREVLAGVGCGLTSKEIAKKLGISSLTVDAHRESLRRKLAAKTTASLVKWAIRLKLTTRLP
jgi:DNA-binding CsgD family transcriptional regulator